MSNKQIKLLPCPFCGHFSTHPYEMSDGWYIDCSNDVDCNFNPSQQNGMHKKEDAINGWNRRFNKGDKQL